MSAPIYKILPRAEWEQAQRDGTFEGSAVDLADGYIHFSTEETVRETAARHFSGQEDLLLLTVDLDCCAAGDLRWEPSRGGALFPHLYGPLDPACVTRADELPCGPDGHRFPAHV